MERIKVINKIVKFLFEKGILQSMDNIEYDSSLSEVYGIDSVGLVEVIIYCEEEFKFKFDYTEYDLKNFKSINTIVNIVEKHIKLVR